MQADSYTEFIIKRSEDLKLANKGHWFRFVFEATTWLVKGQCAANDTTSYSLLVTDLSNVYFTSASTTQILKEIKVRYKQEYNPLIQGGMAGLIPTLNSCISEYNSETQYIMTTIPPMLEIHRTMNAIYDFKWVFSLTRLAPEIGKKVLQSFLVMPLINTVVAQDNLIQSLEEQYKKQMKVDLRYAQNQDFNIKIGPNAKESIQEACVQSIKDEEGRFTRENEKKRKMEEEKRANELKRKNDQDIKPEKRGKPNVAANYQESDLELKRKMEIEARLNKKKEKKKLDFL